MCAMCTFAALNAGNVTEQMVTKNCNVNFQHGKFFRERIDICITQNYQFSTTHRRGQFSWGPQSLILLLVA